MIDMTPEEIWELGQRLKFSIGPRTMYENDHCFVMERQYLDGTCALRFWIKANINRDINAVDQIYISIYANSRDQNLYGDEPFYCSYTVSEFYEKIRFIINKLNDIENTCYIYPDNIVDRLEKDEWFYKNYQQSNFIKKLNKYLLTYSLEEIVLHREGKIC